MKGHATGLLCLAAIGLSTALAGCAETPPSPQSIQSAASPTPDTPAVVEGETLSPCRAEQSLASIDTQAAYSAGYTLAFAERLRNSGAPPVVPYADRVRAYVLKGRGTNIVGTSVPLEAVCYFEMKDGRLRYLTTLRPDRDGRVRSIDVSQAILKSYALMAGKNVGTVQLFGVYAN